MLYREDLENPPLLVTCDMDRLIVHTNFTSAKALTFAIPLAALDTPRNLEILRAVTEHAAAQLGELAEIMGKRGLEPHAVAHYLIRLACLDIHHIIPREENGSNEPSNLILLCKNCHGKVTTGTIPRDEVVVMKRTLVERFGRGVALSEALRAQQALSISQAVVGNGNVVAGRDVIHTPRIITKRVIQPRPEDISEEEAAEIKRLIDELAAIDVAAGRSDSHGKWYGSLYKTFGVTSYKTIPKYKDEDVITWLRQQTDRNMPKLRRTNNEEWRHRRYTAIYAKAIHLGLSKANVYEMAFDRLKLKKPIASLKELGEQNLDRLYRVMISK